MIDRFSLGGATVECSVGCIATARFGKIKRKSEARFVPLFRTQDSLKHEHTEPH